MRNPSADGPFTSYAEIYDRDGVVHIPRALTAENLAAARELFEWSRNHLSAAVWTADPFGNGETIFLDTHNPAARAVYGEVLRNSDLPAIAAAVLGVDQLWFFGEQIFVKKGSRGSCATPWHQDSDFRLDEAGPARAGAVGMWISFESLDAESSLKFVRKSYQRGCLNPVISAKGEPPRFLYPMAKDMELFPDIDADREGHDIVSWPCEPGDIVLFHNLTIHGGAPVPAGGERTTLCVRFIGPDARYVDRERAPNGNIGAESTEYLWDGLAPGMAMHSGKHMIKVYDQR
jgi:ectoine hydroxylase-related dioxygenase (phytanoyl-CoA dioxygenase family)